MDCADDQSVLAKEQGRPAQAPAVSSIEKHASPFQFQLSGVARIKLDYMASRLLTKHEATSFLRYLLSSLYLQRFRAGTLSKDVEQYRIDLRMALFDERVCRPVFLFGVRLFGLEVFFFDI